VAGRLDLRQSGGYFWLYIASSAIGLGAVAVAFTFRPPEPTGLPHAQSCGRGLAAPGHCRHGGGGGLMPVHRQRSPRHDLRRPRALHPARIRRFHGRSLGPRVGPAIQVKEGIAKHPVSDSATDIVGRLELMDAAGVEKQVLSPHRHRICPTNRNASTRCTAQ